jgi:hypothetical protein
MLAHLETLDSYTVLAAIVVDLEMAQSNEL